MDPQVDQYKTKYIIAGCSLGIFLRENISSNKEYEMIAPLQAYLHWLRIFQLVGLYPYTFGCFRNSRREQEEEREERKRERQRSSSHCAAAIIAVSV